MDADKRKELKAFVSGLSASSARRELLLAYEMMEDCTAILRGETPPVPVEMLDNGLSSDLELYYTCIERMEQVRELKKRRSIWPWKRK